jgi:DNA-binding CsgD family transcriptional regulator
MARLFTGLAPDAVTRAYCELCAVGKIPKEEAQDFLGDSSILAERVERGMAHPVPHTPTSLASFLVVPPELALVAIMTRLQGAPAGAHEQLVTCYERLAEAQAKTYAASAQDPSHVIRVLTDRNEIQRLSLDMINSTKQEFLSLEPFAVNEDYAVTLPPALRGGKVRVRAIYDQASVEHPGVAKIMRRSREAGEEQRVLPELPMKMQMADETAVLLPVTRTGGDSALLVRGSLPILAGLRHSFKLLWERGMLVGSGEPSGDCTLNRAQMKVLDNMAQGLTDKAIGCILGISESTVHRHINAIMQGLDPSSRFAAGAAAQRHGWLGGSEATVG